MYLQSPYPPLPSIPPTNYHNLLFRSRPESSDYVMYIDAITGKERKRYEFMERVYDAATALGAERSKGGLGLGSNNMIGILSDNCMEYPVIVHALLAIATPFALLSSYATPRELKHYFQKSACTHVFVHADYLPRLLPVARELNFPEENIFILEGEIRSHHDHQFRSLNNLIDMVKANRIPREPVRSVEYNTLAYLVFSSGTSGPPKAVMISHGNLCASIMQDAVMAMQSNADMDAAHVMLGFLPIFHSLALHYICLKPPAYRATIVLMPRWNLDLALRCIPKYRITFLSLVPSVVHQLVSSPRFSEIDLSSVALIGCGAAYLPPLLAKQMLGVVKHAFLDEGYGMSEATISLIGRPQPGSLGDRTEYVASATGVLVPGVDGLVLRPDGTHCLPNEPGELYVKGANVALGYWNDPEVTKKTFLPDGWLRTGDRFRANTKGVLWFEDRAKDTIKVSGLQVSPAEIEDALLDEPNGLLNDVMVAGVQTPGARTSDDQSPRAWIVLSEKGRQLGEARARKEIEAWMKQCLSKYKWLRGGIKFIDQIPKSPTGKVLRRVLQDQYRAEMASAARL